MKFYFKKPLHWLDEKHNITLKHNFQLKDLKRFQSFDKFVTIARNLTAYYVMKSYNRSSSEIITITIICENGKF